MITSIDDLSRKLLYADFFKQETSWVHIKASQALMEIYGIPLRYYVDSLRVFRFVHGRDSFWREHVLQTDEVEVHPIPDRERRVLEVRTWWENQMMQSVAYPLKKFPGVQFSTFPNRA